MIGVDSDRWQLRAVNRKNEYKSSAVAAMDDRGHSRHGPKIGWGCALFLRGKLGPHRTQSRLDRGLPPCQLPASSIQPFGHNKHGPKIWGLRPPPIWGGGAGSPSNTKLPGPRPSSMPSGILIHAAIWPQQIWAENWGLCPFRGGEVGPPSNTVWPGPRPTCVPSFVLIRPTVWLDGYCNVTDRQTGQRTDSIGRTTNGSPKNASRKGKRSCEEWRLVVRMRYGSLEGT